MQASFSIEWSVRSTIHLGSRTVKPSVSALLRLTVSSSHPPCSWHQVANFSPVYAPSAQIFSVDVVAVEGVVLQEPAVSPRAFGQPCEFGESLGVAALHRGRELDAVKVLDPRERIGEGRLPDNAPRGEPMAEGNTRRVYSTRDSAIDMKVLLIAEFLSRELLSRNSARCAQ